MNFSLFDLPNWLETAITFITGGGAVAAWAKLRRVFLAGEEQEYSIESQLREELNHINDELKSNNDELRGEMSRLHDRINGLEQKYVEEQAARMEAVHRQKELSIAVQALIMRVDDLITRLGRHETITDDERKRLTKVPFIDFDNLPGRE